MNDAETLRRAAVILRHRAHKPDSFRLRVIIRVLDSTAEKIDVEARL